MKDQEKVIRQPSLLDALIPLLFMIVLLISSIVLFGIDAAGGPLQVALLMSAVVAAVVAHKNGHSWEKLGEEIVKGISLAMSAIMILLMVGALIGVWNMSGTIATMVYYGIKYIDPTWFYLAAALLTGLIGIVTGSSWTTAATFGVAFIGMARAIGASEAITAGAVISGAYFGDKMTPLSETTILTPQIVGSNVYAHIRSMSKATVPAYLISLVLFFLIGRSGQVDRAADGPDCGAGGAGERLQHQPVDFAADAGTAAARLPQVSRVPVDPDRHAGGRPGGGDPAAAGRDHLRQ